VGGGEFTDWTKEEPASEAEGINKSVNWGYPTQEKDLVVDPCAGSFIVSERKFF